MARPKLSINDIAAQSERSVVADQSPRVVADTVQREAVVAGQLPRGDVPVAVPAGFRVRHRIEKPHISLYAHPRTLEVVRDLARSQGRKAHAIYFDGLRLVLAQYGYDLDKLERGEV